jgi:ArsR family transcriptional regulator, arsenate/arsenite/antimonite-responsive transcriptional repressor
LRLTKTIFTFGASKERSIAMGATKTEEFTTEENRIAELAKAFAHPARVAILRLLAEKKACVCGDLVEELPLSQATVSQHLKELKRIGIIKGDINPPRVCYCINEVVWEEARQTFEGLLSTLKPAGCC